MGEVLGRGGKGSDWSTVFRIEHAGVAARFERVWVMTGVGAIVEQHGRIVRLEACVKLRSRA